MSVGNVAEGEIRVTCYVDGFNLYHGLKESTKCRPYRWLNLWSLTDSLLLKGHTLKRVVFFTSLTPWDAGKQRRHQTYIAALETAGVEVVHGRFQRDEMLCRASCGQLFRHPTEKLTDVNISTSIMRDAVAGRFDWAYLVSGDADQAPTVAALREVAPKAKMHVIFPPRRESHQLKQLADRWTPELGYRKLKAHQFPARIEIAGRTIEVPKEWL